MLAIKLRRIGKKHQPSYRVVIAEKRSKLGGRYVEDIGWFNPLQNTHDINKDRVSYWLGVGAMPTDTVHNLIIKTGIISGKKRAVHAKSKKKEEAIATPAEGATAEVSATEAPANAPVVAEEEKITESAPSEATHKAPVVSDASEASEDVAEEKVDA